MLGRCLRTLPRSPTTGSSRSPTTSARRTSATRSRWAPPRRSTSSWTPSGSSRACACSTSAVGRGATPTSWPGGGSPATASTSPSASSTWPAQHAPDGATFERLDARALAFDADFDAVVVAVPGRLRARARRRRGPHRARRHGPRRSARRSPGHDRLQCLLPGAATTPRPRWDADTGVAHERTEVRDEQGVAAEVDLWTACYTPTGAPPAGRAGRAAGRRHQRRRAWARYGRAPPDTEHAELLVLATRP